MSGNHRNFTTVTGLSLNIDYVILCFRATLTLESAVQLFICTDYWEGEKDDI